jgi:hypothetical protein
LKKKYRNDASIGHIVQIFVFTDTPLGCIQGRIEIRLQFEDHNKTGPQQTERQEFATLLIPITNGVRHWNDEKVYKQFDEFKQNR